MPSSGPSHLPDSRGRFRAPLPGGNFSPSPRPRRPPSTSSGTSPPPNQVSRGTGCTGNRVRTSNRFACYPVTVATPSGGARRSNPSPRPLSSFSQGGDRDEARAGEGAAGAPPAVSPGPGTAPRGEVGHREAGRAATGSRGRAGGSGFSSRGGGAGDVSRAGRAELGPTRGGGGERAERQTRGRRRPSGAGGSAAGAVGAGGGAPGSPRASSARRRRRAFPRPALHGALAPRASPARLLPASGAASVCGASAQTEPPANLSGAERRRSLRQSPPSRWRAQGKRVRQRRRRPHPRTSPPPRRGALAGSRTALRDTHCARRRRPPPSSRLRRTKPPLPDPRLAAAAPECAPPGPAAGSLTSPLPSPGRSRRGSRALHPGSRMCAPAGRPA